MSLFQGRAMFKIAIASTIGPIFFQMARS